MGDELPLNDVRLEPVKGSPAWKFREIRRFKELAAQHQGLTSTFFAQIALGVSKQRVYQLIESGRLPAFEILGKKLIPCDELERFAALERSSGFRYGSSAVA
jgi:excisionase family DNA binding protein